MVKPERKIKDVQKVKQKKQNRQKDQNLKKQLKGNVQEIVAEWEEENGED